MALISCYVVDDEPLALELMEGYVRKTPFLELKGSFGSGTQAFSALEREPVDLLFCDIQMPGLTGMELSRMIPERTRVIFTTAFSQYAIEGFKVQALDYLLKPISYADFLAASLRAQEWFSRQETTQPAVTSQAQASIESLFIKTEYRLQQVLFDDILYVEGMKDYARIILEGGLKPILCLTTLKELENRLPTDRFFRVSKSYIVNLPKIHSIERGRIVFGTVHIPISDNVRDEFYRSLSRFSLLP